MQPKVGDKITAPNGSVWFVREGEKLNLLDNIKKVRGTNEWRPIKAGDWIVTTGKMIRQIQAINVLDKDVRYTIGTWDKLQTVDYIAPNEFDLCEGDFAVGDGRLGVVKKFPDGGHLYIFADDYKYRLSNNWRRVDAPVQRVTEQANPNVGKWFQIATSDNKLVAVLCTKHESDTYVLEQPNGRFSSFLCFPYLMKLEQLRVEGDYLIGKSATYDLKTGYPITPKANRQLLGAWFEVPECKPFPAVAVQLQEISPQGEYVLRQPNGDLTVSCKPEFFGKYEQLRVEDHYLIGKSATYNKSTGMLLNWHDTFCGKWYEMRVHNKLMPMFCYDFRNGMLQFEDVHKRTFMSMEPMRFRGHEELKIEGDKLVGKANTYDLKTGGRVVMTVNADPSKMDAALEKTKSMLGNFQNAPPGKPLSMDAVMKAIELSEKVNGSMWLGPPLNFSAYKVFTEQAVQAIVSQFSIPMKLWLPSEETTLPHCSFRNPHKIKPTSEMPNEDIFTIGGIPGCNFQHVYMRTAGGSAVRIHAGDKTAKQLTKEQLKNAKFLKLHHATIRSKKKLHWALENVENIYTDVCDRHVRGKRCRIEYLEIEGRVCKNYVAIWQDKNFCVLHIDQIIGKLYYFKVVT